MNWKYVDIENEDHDAAGDDIVVVMSVLPFCWGQRHGEEGDEQQQGCHQVQPGRKGSMSTKIWSLFMSTSHELTVMFPEKDISI